MKLDGFSGLGDKASMDDTMLSSVALSHIPASVSTVDVLSLRRFDLLDTGSSSWSEDDDTLRCVDRNLERRRGEVVGEEV